MKINRCPCCGSVPNISYMGPFFVSIKCSNRHCHLQTRRFASIQDAADCWNERADHLGGRISALHEFRVTPRQYDDIMCRLRRFHVCRYDSDVKIGDIIHLHEVTDEPTGRVIRGEITAVLPASECPEGIEDGYCIVQFDINHSGSMI